MALALCLSLGACASGAQPEMMATQPLEGYTASSNNKYFQAISIANITGGSETNPLLVSKIINTAFQTALEESLRSHNLLNDSTNSKYELNSELLALEQPVFGLSFKVDSVASYKLQRTSDKQISSSETIKFSGTAMMGDAFIGTERLRVANKKSVQNNIQTFIDKLLSN